MCSNCRGAVNKAFYRYCKKYLDNNKPSILVIMETRCDPLKVKQTLSKLGFDAIDYSGNVGFAGGIIIAWKSTDISLQVCRKDN